MTGILMMMGLIITIFVMVFFMRNINNENSKKVKYTILIGPFILSAILYSSIFLLTKNIPPETCDGAFLMGLFISFVFLGVGIIFNLINIISIMLKKS